MNIILFFLFFLLSIIGIEMELHKRKINLLYYFIYFLSFISCGLSRIGNSKEESDLTHYLSYFKNDNFAYFEPGYTFLTSIIKNYFFDSPFALIFCIGSIIFLCAYYTSYFISKMENNNDYAKFNYGFILLMVYLTYWGLSFEAERLRIGIGTSLFLLSLVLIFNKRKFAAIILIGIAILFQYTIAILIPLILILILFDNKKLTSYFNRNVFIIWFFILICGRLLLYFLGTSGFISNSIDVLKSLVNYSGIEHYESYVKASIKEVNVFSLKDIFYFVCGYFMIIKGTKFSNYNTIVIIYFIGLTLNVFLVGFNAGHRISDMFMVVNCIAIAYMGFLKLLSKEAYRLYLYLILLAQSVMSINYLGLSW